MKKKKYALKFFWSSWPFCDHFFSDHPDFQKKDYVKGKNIFLGLLAMRTTGAEWTTIFKNSIYKKYKYCFSLTQ